MVNFDIGGDTVASEGSRGLDFAKKQLEKHGWTEGKGLGKNETGRASAIKVGVKKDTLGVGFDVGKEFTNNWWDSLFNKAASNIVVEESKNGVQVSKKDTGHDVTSSKKLWRVKGKELYYGRFIKASDDVTPVSRLENPEVQTKFSDEELFKACGGRTAHKSARHGHKLSGKLKRIAEQEDQGSPSKKTKVKRKKCLNENISLTSNGIGNDKNGCSEETKELDPLENERTGLKCSNAKQYHGTEENPCILSGDKIEEDICTIACNESETKSLKRKKHKTKTKKIAKYKKNSVQENKKGPVLEQREKRCKTNELGDVSDRNDGNLTKKGSFEANGNKRKRTKKKKKTKKEFHNKT